jgi:hypothetical protein
MTDIRVTLPSEVDKVVNCDVYTVNLATSLDMSNYPVFIRTRCRRQV